MKSILKFSSWMLFTSILLFSCRSEEREFEQAPEEEVLEANSQIANLMQRTSMNDGSLDNILDRSNCFSIQFPVTVTANGLEIIITNEDGLDTVEDIFDELEDDDDTITFSFPIVIILSDFTEVTINNNTELESFSGDCNGEDEEDDDIECIDFQYPITASLFNTNNDLIGDVTITSDNELYDFIDDLEDNIIVNVDFPITVILSDGSTVEINNLIELENVIEDAEDDCDEDDDYDFDDDDCNDCSTDQLSTILTTCTNWIVDKLERNDMDLEDQYSQYVFNFATDGTLTAVSSSDNFSGTWESNGTGNSIVVTVDIPDLVDFNNNWILHEIEQYTNETKVDLRLGDDRLRFESDCNN
ncbi:hypothetical protein [Aquimarina rubra]|uniref:Lipocalin-like domain-containing protein n=1 Tax=Aquimarina rubra TaxID=1920033 RepID=A0ABW5LIT8_9FLAO